MSLGKLSDLQVLVLQLAAAVRPRWTLTGGGALAGFHTQHRETRDLDLFFRGARELGDRVNDVRHLLEAGGLHVAVLRTTPMFAQLDVRDATSAVVVDLVADPTPIAETPQAVFVDGFEILLETPHQILVNKLCALLSRSELRDLIEVRTLLDAGGELSRALIDAPKQDGGFSPLTFSWSLKNLQVGKLAAALGGHTAVQIERLERFQAELVDEVLGAANPG